MEKNRNCVPSIHFDIRGYSAASVVAMYLRLLDINGPWGHGDIQYILVKMTCVIIFVVSTK